MNCIIYYYYLVVLLIWCHFFHYLLFTFLKNQNKKHKTHQSSVWSITRLWFIHMYDGNELFWMIVVVALILCVRSFPLIPIPIPVKSCVCVWTWCAFVFSFSVTLNGDPRCQQSRCFCCNSMFVLRCELWNGIPKWFYAWMNETWKYIHSSIKVSHSEWNKTTENILIHLES